MVDQQTERKQNTSQEKKSVITDKEIAQAVKQALQTKEITPELITAVKQAVAGSFGEAIREGLSSGRRESQPYPVVKGEWAKELVKGTKDLPPLRTPHLAEKFQHFLTQIADFEKRDLIGPVVLSNWLSELGDLYQRAKEINDPGAESIGRMITNLEEISKQRQFQSSELGSVYFQLTGDEVQEVGGSFEGAERAIERWVSAIERSNVFAHESINETYFRKYQAVIGWLPTLKYPYVEIDGRKETDPQKIEQRKIEMINQFRFRIEMHNMRIAVAHFDWHEVVPQATHMGSGCIFEAFKIKNASVALNLYQRYFEKHRFVYGKIGEKKGVAKWRLTPEEIYYIRREVENDLRQNFALYGFRSAEEAENASRIGYNLFEASMRMAVHVARGQIKRVDMEQVIDEDTGRPYRKPTLEPAFQSDPDELLANLYNPRQFKIDKWTAFGEPQYKLFERILKSLGNGDMVVGDQEFNNILSIVDYFSSTWRIKNLPEPMKVRMMKAGLSEKESQERIDTLATGLWLQWQSPTAARSSKDPLEVKNGLKTAEKRLKAVARFRPLELIKAYAVTFDPEGKEYSTGERQQTFQEMLRKGEFNTSRVRINNYVKLEEILGRYIYPIYDRNMLVIDPQTGKPTTDWREYWSRIHGIDIGNPQSPEDLHLIKETIEEVNRQIPENERLTVEEVQTLYRKLQQFLLDEKTICDLRDNPYHSHLYHKTLYIDDAPIGMLEEEIDGIPKLSQKLYEIEGGRRDPFARMWGDTEGANIVVNHLFNAMNARDPETLIKELRELADPLTGYAGRPPFQKLAFNVAVGWLELAKPDFIWGFLGLAGKVPWATSEGERLFGLAFPTLNPKERRAVYEKIKVIFGDLLAEPGGRELDKKIKKRLGIEDYQVALYAVRLIAFVIILSLFQDIFKQVEEEDK